MSFDSTLLLPILGAITAFLKFLTPIVTGCFYLLLKKRGHKSPVSRNRRR